MTANPDINRLSLEERLRRLETRLPAPGLGGTADFLLNPKIIDECKDNAVTDVDTGLVFKFTIDNFYDLNARASSGYNPGKCFNNLELRGAVFLPRVNGTLWGPTGVMHRAYIKNSLGNIPQPIDSNREYNAIADINIDAGVFLSEVAPFFPSHTSIYIVNMARGGISFFENPQGTPTSSNVSGTISLMEFGYIVRKKTNSNQFEIAYHFKGTKYISGSPSKYGFYTVYPSCSFGLSIQTNASIFSQTGASGFVVAGGTPTMSGFTGRLPSDLPERYKFMFPTSWYS